MTLREFTRVAKNPISVLLRKLTDSCCGLKRRKFPAAMLCILTLTCTSEFAAAGDPPDNREGSQTGSQTGNPAGWKNRSRRVVSGDRQSARQTAQKNVILTASAAESPSTQLTMAEDVPVPASGTQPPVSDESHSLNAAENAIPGQQPNPLKGLTPEQLRLNQLKAIRTQKIVDQIKQYKQMQLAEKSRLNSSQRIREPDRSGNESPEAPQGDHTIPSQSGDSATPHSSGDGHSDQPISETSENAPESHEASKHSDSEASLEGAAEHVEPTVPGPELIPHGSNSHVPAISNHDAHTAIVEGPIDRLSLANNLYASGQLGLALEMYAQIDRRSLTPQDKYWVEYQSACCLRKLRRIDEAKKLYRQLVGTPEAGFLTEMSRWWLDRMADRAALEAEIRNMQTTIDAMKESQDGTAKPQ